MNISDIINITEGQLVNSPKIQAIEAASVYASKIDHGDLFFSSLQEDIDTAIANGAYAIVYDNDEIIQNDTEIAWIKVTDIALAAMKLVRFVLLKKEADFYLLTHHELSFVKMLINDRRSISIIPSDWKKAFEMMVNSPSRLFIGDDEELLRLIKPDVKRLKKEVEWQIVTETLFRSTFKMNNYVYQDYELAPFHMEAFSRALAFFETHEIKFEIEKLRYTKHFLPVFIDNNLQTVPSGKSDKVVVFIDNMEDVAKSREYMKYKMKWLKSIVLTPPKTKIEGYDNPIWFNDANDVHSTLKNRYYNYAFILNSDKSILPKLQENFSLFYL
jgi:ferrochelatase